MVLDLLSIVLICGACQTKESPAPLAPICFSASESGAIVSNDILELKQNWRSKDWVVLRSGNVGYFQNGCYYIVDSRTPLLDQIRQKYILAKRIIELACGEKGRPGFCLSSGVDFDQKNVKCLASQIRRWTGLSLDTSSISSNKKLLFAIGGIKSFSGNGQSVTIPPKVKFPTDESRDGFISELRNAGNLAESREEGLRTSQGEGEATLIGTENDEGRLNIRMFNTYSQVIDYYGIQESMLKLVHKVHQSRLKEYRADIAMSSQQFRSKYDYLFHDFNVPTLSETELNSSKLEIIDKLTQQGYSASDAARSSAGLIFTGRDIEISLLSSIQRFDHPKTNFAAKIQVWP